MRTHGSAVGGDDEDAVRRFWGVCRPISDDERDHLTAAAVILRKRIRADRLSSVLARPAAVLGGKSLKEMAAGGDAKELHDEVAKMFGLKSF